MALVRTNLSMFRSLRKQSPIVSAPFGRGSVSGRGSASNCECTKSDSRSTGILNLEQYLELLLGPKEASAFETDFARRAAWHAHQAELLPLVDPGSRPWAWWQYDAPEPVLAREPELAYLERCQLLSNQERIQLQYAGIYAGSHATRNP